MNHSDRKPTPTTARQPAGRFTATLPAFTALLSLLLTLALSPSARAATHSWINSSSGPTTPWSDSANWSAGSVPPAGTSSTIINFGAGSGSYSSSNNISSTLRVNQLNITAGTVTINGLGLSMRNAGATLDNTSGNAAIINNPISLSASAEVHTAAGSDITLGGIVSGTTTYSLTKTGTGTLVLGGANTFGGGLFIQRGTVASGGTSQKVFGGNGDGAITLGDASVGADVALVADYRPSVPLANPITVAGGAGTRTIQGSHTTANTLTFSGAITLEKDVTLNYTSTAGTSLIFSGGFTGTGSVTLKADGTKPMEVSGGIDSTGSITNSGSGSGTVTISGNIGSGILDIVQNSAGSKMVIGGAYAHTGDTKVLAGTLSFSQAALGDSSTVAIASGATLELTHASTDTVGVLITNGVVLPGGIYDSTNLPGFIAGTGVIEVVPQSSFTLTYTAGPNGTISGTSPQTVDSGADGTPVTAVPNTGYHFVSWSDGNTNSTRTDTNVLYNISVTASFAPNFYTLIYVAGTGGTITGTTTQVVAHAASGTSVTAVPSTGYHFVNWSDGLLTKARQEVNVTSNATFTANFAIDDVLTWAIGNGSWDFSSPNWTNSSGVVTNYNIADLVQFNDDNTGGSEIAVALNTAVNPTSMTVSNSAKNYTIGGSGGIGGTTGLKKFGVASLTLTGNHAYTGNTAVSNGTLRIGDGSVNGAVSESKIAMATNTTLVFDIPSSQTSTCNGVISGEGAVVKNGAGTAVLSANENYTGPTLVSAGTLQIGAGSTTGNVGGDLTNNATVRFYRSQGRDLSTAFYGTGDIVFDGVGSGTISYALTNNLNTNFTGTITVNNGMIGRNSGTTPEGLGAAHTVTAVTDATLWLTNSGIGGGSFTNHFVVGGTGHTDGGSYGVYGVIRFVNAVISGNVTMQSGSRIQVDTGRTGEISGILSGADSALEVGRSGGGTGTLILSGANTYSGDTTISSGTLALSGSGSIAGSPNITVNSATTLDVSAVPGGFTLGAAQTLKGSGLVIGPANMNGTLAPYNGAFSIGTLTFSNNLTLGGTCTMDIDSFTPAADLVSLNSTATLTYGGTLTVQDLGGGLAEGQSFTLFSANAYSGDFVTMNLPTIPDAGLKWQWTPANGTLKVVSTNAVIIDPTPTNLTYTVSSNVMTFSWPSSHIGWTLQWQTNSRAIGLSNNWNDVVGSTITNQVVVTNSPADPPTFYRLRYTLP